MRAQDHPQFDEEQARLDLTLRHIREFLRDDAPPVGGDDWADQNLARFKAADRELARAAEQEAYLARIDVQEGDVREIYYVGRHYLNFPNFPQEAIVYSWASPQIGELFYLGAPDRLLKRVFQIDHDNLLTINDEFVHPSLLENANVVAVTDEGEESSDRDVSRYTDSVLHRLLSQNRKGQLHDIVATIQEQQYRIIQSPADRLLVIQGAAGSGKSSIALHRVAYLLFNHRERFKRIVVLGPNKLFVEYTSHILPSLGERNIPQKTVDDLLLEIVGVRVDHLSMDAAMESLLSDTVDDAEKRPHYRTARLKGSLAMATLLERYVHMLAAPPKMTAPPFVFRVQRASPHNPRQRFTVEARRMAADIEALLDMYRTLPLYRMWDEVEKRLALDVGRELFAMLRREMAKAGAWLRDYDEGGFQRELERESGRMVRRYLNGWKRRDAPTIYRRLLGAATELAAASEGVLGVAEIELLARSAPRAGTPFHFADLPAVAYLKILLEGTDNSGGSNVYDHIVVDEAQDLSPLHFKILSRLMHTPSMTVLGDLAQGIYAHAGIGVWEELEQATGQRVERERIAQSYRSTQQITDFANAMLTRAVGDDASLAIPITRPGPAPTFNGATDISDLAATVAELIAQESGRGRQSIAVICKTVAACAALDGPLAAAGCGDYRLLTDRDATLTSGAVIIPAYLAKGLEFDAVIVADADSRTYRADKRRVDGKLLYVAVTRATHALHLCWVGKPTPLLGVPEQVARATTPTRERQRAANRGQPSPQEVGRSRPFVESDDIIVRENAYRYDSTSDRLAAVDNKGHNGLHTMARQRDGRFLSDIVADDYGEESGA